MAAIGLRSEDVTKFLKPGVVIACENSPRSTTISGDLDQLDKILENIKAQRPNITVRQLKVDMAYHSRKLLIAQTVIKADMIALKITCTRSQRLM